MVSPQLINFAVSLSATDAAGFSFMRRFHSGNPTGSAKRTMGEWDFKAMCLEDSFNSAK
jgi:hypothetical protein